MRAVYQIFPESSPLPSNELVLVDESKARHPYRKIAASSGVSGVCLLLIALTLDPIGITKPFLYTCACYAGLRTYGALSMGVHKDPVVRRFINKIRSEDNQIFEEVISEKISAPYVYPAFAERANPLITLATNQSYDLDTLTLALNHLFRDTPPPQEMRGDAFDGAQKAISRVAGFEEEYDYSHCPENQFLFLSNLMIHLRQNPNVLNQIDRNEFGQRYEEFCDQKFLPYCSEHFGDVQSRFANAYVNVIRPVARGEGQADFLGLVEYCRMLREFHENVPDVPLQNLGHFSALESSLAPRNGELQSPTSSPLSSAEDSSWVEICAAERGENRDGVRGGSGR
jgi:hypothetical protein